MLNFNVNLYNIQCIKALSISDGGQIALKKNETNKKCPKC